LLIISWFLNYIQCPLLKNKHISNPALVPTLRSMGEKTPSKLGLREKLFLITGPLTTFLFYITKEITSTEVVYSLKIYYYLTSVLDPTLNVVVLFQGLQYHNIHTRFHKNWSIDSNAEKRETYTHICTHIQTPW